MCMDLINNFKKNLFSWHFLNKQMLYFHTGVLVLLVFLLVNAPQPCLPLGCFCHGRGRRAPRRCRRTAQLRRRNPKKMEWTIPPWTGESFSAIPGTWSPRCGNTQLMLTSLLLQRAAFQSFCDLMETIKWVIMLIVELVKLKLRTVQKILKVLIHFVNSS